MEIEDYCPCYCEENVYLLCKRREDFRDYVVFISSPRGVAPIWKQRRCKGDTPVFWDYHVLLVGQEGIYDLDSQLPWPSPPSLYLEQALRPLDPLTIQLNTHFRIIEGVDFLARFASDRTHMIDKDGRWQQPPPAWPMIQSGGESMNLFEYVDMQDQGTARFLCLFNDCNGVYANEYDVIEGL